MAVGIIAEYNPFHNGHKLHIDKTKSELSDDIVLVMSPNYVQRGEPAIIDKWTRTSMALENGVSVVIEMPTPFATSSAELFALAGVTLLEKTEIINTISFGSESGNIETLSEIASILTSETDEYKNHLKNYLSQGLVFPVARAKALSTILPIDDDVINNPNNILAIEYIKALKNIGSSIKPYTIQREKVGYHSSKKVDNISSATGIRKAILNQDTNFISSVVPAKSYDKIKTLIDKGTCPIYLNDFSSDLNYKLRISDKSYISSILDVTEGIENRIYESLNYTYNISDMLSFIKTKRYTHTKIQRALLHILLDIKKTDLEKYQMNFCPYIRILGFRKDKSNILSEISKKSSVPVITNINKLPKNLSDTATQMIYNEIMYTDLYFSHCPNTSLRQIGQEYTRPIVIF